MFDNFALILGLINKAGEITTRKKIQKIIYLLQQKHGLFDENFSLHFYGPYSSELQIELDQLAEGKLITQELDDIGNSYKFKLTNEANELMISHKEYFDNINKDLPERIINELNKLSPRLLEVMATIAFFERKYGPHKDILRGEINKIKPHLIGLFDLAWENLDKFDLHLSK